MRKFYTVVIVSLLLNGWPLLSYAALYQVEVVVFQNTQTSALTAEDWLSYPPLPKMDNAIRIREYNPGDSQQAYRFLPRNRQLLNAEANRIEQDPNYRLLLHAAWLQPIPHPNGAKSIQLQSLENIATSAYQQASPQLQGTLTLSQLNYINLRTDLVIQIANSYYPVKHSRRLQMDELYYLDNPVVGILIKVEELS